MTRYIVRMRQETIFRTTAISRLRLEKIYKYVTKGIKYGMIYRYIKCCYCIRRKNVFYTVSFPSTQKSLKMKHRKTCTMNRTIVNFNRNISILYGYIQVRTTASANGANRGGG